MEKPWRKCLASPIWISCRINAPIKAGQNRSIFISTWFPDARVTASMWHVRRTYRWADWWQKKVKLTNVSKLTNKAHRKNPMSFCFAREGFGKRSASDRIRRGGASITLRKPKVSGGIDGTTSYFFCPKTSWKPVNLALSKALSILKATCSAEWGFFSFFVLCSFAFSRFLFALTNIRLDNGSATTSLAPNGSQSQTTLDGGGYWKYS